MAQEQQTSHYFYHLDPLNQSTGLQIGVIHILSTDSRVQSTGTGQLRSMKVASGNDRSSARLLAQTESRIARRSFEVRSRSSSMLVLLVFSFTSRMMFCLRSCDILGHPSVGALTHMRCERCSGK